MLHRKAHDGTWVSWLGAPAQFLALGAETGDGYCLSRAMSPAGGAAPPHRHDFDEGFFLLAGQLTFRAGNRTFALTAGDFVNIGADVAHGLRNESAAPAEVLVLCAPAGFDRFQIEGGTPLDGPDDPPVPVDDAAIEKLRAAAQRHGIDLDPPASGWEETPRAHATRAGEGATLDVVGDRYRMLATGEQTGGRYALWHATIGPGGGPPPHTHTREDEGFLVLDGALTFSTDEGSLRASAGEFLHLPRDRRHWFKNETDRPAHALLFVAPAGFEQMFFETGRPVSDATAPIHAPTAEDGARLVAAAARYGVTIDA